MPENTDRESLRFATYVEADLYRTESIISIGKGFITDISCSGLGFRSDAALVKGQLAQADLIMESGEIVNVTFRIVRAESVEKTNSYGGIFESNPEAVLCSIEEYINAKIKNSSGA